MKRDSDELAKFLALLSGELTKVANRFAVDSGTVSRYLSESDIVLVPELSQALQRSDAAFQVIEGIAEVLKLIADAGLTEAVQSDRVAVVLESAISTLKIEELRAGLLGKPGAGIVKPDDDIWD